jgi:uncharacterized membrane protein YfcA
LDLLPYQYFIVGLLFVWGGFVRSGIGFGGAVLTLPFLLLVLNKPLVFLPIIAIHLLIFSALTVYQNHQSSQRGDEDNQFTGIDWAFLKHALLVMAIPKLIGVFGVITLPANIISGFVFIVVTVYAFSYLLNRPFKSRSATLDTVFLVVGGYVSGTSLIAAPLVVPVAASHVNKYQLRDTLFVLWFVLVLVKIVAFMLAGVDMQWAQHLWLLPCAAIGHALGLRFHKYTLRADTAIFFRVLGASLLTVSLAGLWRVLG